MPLGTILLIIVVLLLIGAIPTWPHSRGWGYGRQRRCGAGVADRDHPVADG